VIDPTFGRPDPRNDAPSPFGWGPAGGPREPVLHDPFLHPQPAPAQKRRAPWLLIIAVTSTALFLVATGALVWMWQTRLGAALPTGTPTGEPFRDIPPPPSVIAPAPPQPSPSADPSALPAGVPHDTLVTERGTITVVDLGVRSQKALTDDLAAQRAAAQGKGQTLILTTTQFGEKLFRDFDAALPHPLMQSALAGVRLVRVDSRFFTAELDEMGVPTQSYPWFFTLGPDLVPRDRINGGEWDDDIPRNIAPVLGAFVKGTYKTRREVWRPPPRRGVQL